MEFNNLFSIGDMAKLFHLSVGSLRHYEEIGLLQPEWVDPNSGYRYYSARQFEPLNTIRYLRALDMPLGEIADFMQNKDVERMEEKLCQQKNAVIRKKQELERIERKIDNRLQQLYEAKNAVLEQIELVQLPDSRIVFMEDSLNINGFLDMQAPIRTLTRADTEAIVFLGKVGVAISGKHLQQGIFTQYDGIFLVLDEEDQYEGKTRFLPGSLCVRIRFCGSHGEAPAQYKKLMHYIQEHKLKVTGFSREITMIDYGFTNDLQKFVTEISIPVTKE